MQTTNISWATYSWNPVTGCTHAGPECTNCYAETLTRRQATREDPPAYASAKPWTPAHADEVVTVHEDRLDEPVAYGFPEGPGRVFVCSMSDLFHRLVPESFIRRVLAVAWQFPEHVWICLTKRPARAASIDVDWPPNAWVGTSVGSGPGGEYPDTTHRIDQLRDCDADTLWVSFEPLIEPIGAVDLTDIDWAVVGGESAPAAERREMDHAWARDLLRQCREQDVAYHFKQSSGRYPDSGIELQVSDEFGTDDRRVIREFPATPQVTAEAREGVLV